MQFQVGDIIKATSKNSNILYCKIVQYNQYDKIWILQILGEVISTGKSFLKKRGSTVSVKARFFKNNVELADDWEKILYLD